MGLEMDRRRVTQARSRQEPLGHLESSGSCAEASERARGKRNTALVIGRRTEEKNFIAAREISEQIRKTSFPRTDNGPVGIHRITFKEG